MAMMMKFALMALVAFLAALSIAYASQGNTQPATSDSPPPPPIFCYDNSDCPQGYACVNETCVQQPLSCGNGICGEGEFCYNCPSDCGACPPGDWGSGVHDPPPMRSNYPAYLPPMDNQTPPAGNETQNNSRLAPQTPPATLPSALQPSQNNEVPENKQLQKQDIISDIARALNLDGFLNTLAAAIGNIPPALVLAVFGLFAIAGAAGAYCLFAKKKGEGG